jgi:Protein of unknown function (DUF2934)
MARRKNYPKQAAAAQQTVAAKPAATVSPVTRQEAQGVVEQRRHHMIAEAAYLIAEQRGFQGDLALNDWLQAEAAVDARFAARH